MRPHLPFSTKAFRHATAASTLSLTMLVTPWVSANLPRAGAQTFANNAHHAALPVDEPTRGLHFGGLRPAGAASPCGDALEVPIAGGTLCTHGPDQAPIGVDVTRAASVADLRADQRNRAMAAAAETPSATTAPGAVYCYGDGTTGKRVETIYVHASDVASRYASLLPTLRAYGSTMDGVYSNSAAETGGTRHVRFVTDAACNLVVRDVTVSATGDDSFSNTVSELRAKGYNRSDREYVLWSMPRSIAGSVHSCVTTPTRAPTPTRPAAGSAGPT